MMFKRGFTLCQI